MKFLCISCNTQMKLIKNDEAVTPDGKGSLTIRWECPDCLYELGMFTNAYETQMVSSLGVEIGGKTVSKDQQGTAASSSTNSAGKCPFSQTARDAMMGSINMGTEVEKSENSEVDPNPQPIMNEADSIKAAMGDSSHSSTIQWTAQAVHRLQNIPSFVRPAAKQGIEKLARDRGNDQITETFLDEAKEHFNM